MKVDRQDLPLSVSPFDEIAAEYYDASRHPTCANFRFASTLPLEIWLAEYRGEPLCEVGCGKSLTAEILLQRNSSLANVLLTDDSPAMLEYSRPWTAHGVQLKLASADELPLESGSLRYLVSCLGDPYNTRSLWREVARVLAPQGGVFYSTPAHHWSQAFRQAQAANEAEFQLGDGRYVMIPSYIYPEAEQTRLMEEAGLRVVDISTITLGDLATQPLSSKLLAGRGPQAPVVTYFRAVKLNAR